MFAKNMGPPIAGSQVIFSAKQGEFVAILGPSGCGKTTTLRMGAGFVQPTSGRVAIGGKNVTRLAPHAPDTGMVFRGYALFLHMTVAQNVAFGLEMRGVPKAERDAKIREALRLVHLDEHAERYPSPVAFTLRYYLNQVAA